jgi:hypothetical protein
MGGYTYAGDNPASGSDPSGLMRDGSDGSGDAWTKADFQYWGYSSQSQMDAAAAAAYHGETEGGGKDWIGGVIDSVVRPVTTITGHGSTALDKAEDHIGIDRNTFSYERGAGFGTGVTLLAGVGGAGADLDAEASIDGESLSETAANSGGGRPAEDMEAPASSGRTTEPSKADAGTSQNPKAEHDAHSSGADDAHSSGSEDAPSSAAKSARDDAAESNGGKCSFSPDTPVLLAKGKTKPIGEIKKGDEVESADPTTGKHKGPREVQAVWINHDTDLLDVTIEGSDGKAATLHTTANHPFWDDTTHTWVPAGKLKPGEALNTATDTHATVLSTHTIPGAANRWNLTVQQLHTYYVLAGTTPVLVHNTCGEIDYGSIDADGRRSGIVAEVTPNMLGTGGKASRSMNPPGFVSGANGDARGHLLPKALGGSGNTPENFVRTTAAIDNGPMNEFEKEIAEYVSKGNTIMYSATPHYRPGSNVPFAVSIEAFDDTGWYVGRTFKQ